MPGSPGARQNQQNLTEAELGQQQSHEGRVPKARESCCAEGRATKHLFLLFFYGFQVLQTFLCSAAAPEAEGRGSQALGISLTLGSL